MTLPNDATIKTLELGHGQLASVFSYANTSYGGVNHDRYLTVSVPDGYKSDFTTLFATVEKGMDRRVPNIKKVLKDWPNNHNITTAVLAHTQGPNITAAWAGDSRATIFIYKPETNTVTGHALTTDHNIKNAAERERVFSHDKVSPNSRRTHFKETIRTEYNLEGSTVAFSRGLGNRAHGEWFSSVPEICKHNLNEPEFGIQDGDIVFLAVETDGTHMGYSAQAHARSLEDKLQSQASLRRFKEKKPIEVTAEFLAQYFGEHAIDNEGKDNMTCIVTQLDLQSPHSHIIEAFDGAGIKGYLPSQAAKDLFEKGIKGSKFERLKSWFSPTIH